MNSNINIKDELLAQSVHHEAAVRKANFSDISHVFNLTQECSALGYFNNVYLKPRYQAGLALQLFSIVLLGRIRLPSATWHKATLYVIHHEGAFAGFILMRYLESSGTRQEIYMCAIETQYRGNGLGRQLIQSVLEKLKGNSIVEAECLPQAVYMKRLLRHMGFKSIPPAKATTLNNIAEKFRISRGLI